MKQDNGKVVFYNAVAVLDIVVGEITAILPLGFKGHSIAGNELDASINIRNWPVFSMYNPDAIASYGYNGETYYLTRT